jgi:hypothetical protein
MIESNPMRSWKKGCDMAKHQSIREIRKTADGAEVEVGIKELTANWRCAASLADKEGMHGTADRLRHDADTFDLLAKSGDFVIKVDTR